MSKRPTLQQVRKKFEARTSQIKREHEKKIKKLEARIEEHKTERDARLAEAEKQFRKDFGVVVKWIVGEEDYSWLSKWLMKNREKEIEEAESKNEAKRTNELREMCFEDYLFYYFYYYFENPEVERRLKKEMEQNESEETERLSSILAKLKLQKFHWDRTRI
jgi:hypothetical protein